MFSFKTHNMRKETNKREFSLLVSPRKEGFSSFQPLFAPSYISPLLPVNMGGSPKSQYL
jgi:hypothetical protein